MSDYRDDYEGVPRLTVENNRMRYGMFSWQGQAMQYDQLGPPNEIVYRRYHEGQATFVDCLLHYDKAGKLDGILNTYPFGAQSPDGMVTEHPGSVNAFIRPDVADQDGLYKLMLTDARRRWPDIGEDVDFEKQRSTEVRFGPGTGMHKDDLDARDALRRTVRMAGGPAPMRGDGTDGNRRISRLKR